jgi:hypothetical protein
MLVEAHKCPKVTPTSVAQYWEQAHFWQLITLL